MDKLRRWNAPQQPPKPEVLPIGEWLHWTICRDNKIVNEVTRWPNVEF